MLSCRPNREGRGQNGRSHRVRGAAGKDRDAARGMAQAAAKNADVFIEHGLSKDFLEQFRGATSALSDALGARVESQRRRTIANKAVAELVKKGNVAVQMLDAVVTPRLARDPDLLAAWKSVKRPTETGG